MLHDSHLHTREGLLHVALNVARVIDELGLEQATHERNLVQQLHHTDLLGGLCATHFDAGVHGNSHNSLMDEQMDELVPVERQLESLGRIKHGLK